MKVYLVFQRDASEEYETHVSAVFKDEEKAKQEVANLLDEACINHSDSEEVINTAEALAEKIGLEFWYEEAEVTE